MPRNRDLLKRAKAWRWPADQPVRSWIAVLCVLLIVPGSPGLSANQAQPAPTEQATTLLPEQLDSLVAPIALYPDPMLSQTLVACTYPLEIVQLQQWLGNNPGLKDQALVDAVKKQDWDPSIQAMAALPEVVKQLADNIKWTAELGNAFLAQQSDVMDAVQRMRKKAQDNGILKPTPQQWVETKVVESKTVIVVAQADPDIIYVPSYNPVVVYGPPVVYAYPPIVYPPPPPSAYWTTAAIAFGVGVFMGAAWHGGWGYHCGWGHNDIDINVNNNFNRNANINRGNNNLRGGGNKWQHNPQHRGATPYSDRATADRFGGSARGDSPSNRQSSARQGQGQGRSGGGPQAGTVNRGASGGSGSRGASAGNMSASRGGREQVGSRQVSGAGSYGGRSAFGGASGGMGGGSTRASSQRGASSMSSRGGGGHSRGGGGGGGRRR